MKRSLLMCGPAMVLLGVLAGDARAQVLFSDNFETSGAGGATTLSAPWEMNKEVYSSAGAYIGGYYPGFTFGPNAIVTGQGGPSQGTYQGKVWPDYDYAPDWTNGKIQKISLLVTRRLSSADIASGRIEMNFDSKLQPLLGPDTQATAWMKLLSPDFSQLWWQESLTLSGSTWSSNSVGMNFDGSQVNANLQWGFTVSSTNYQDNGLFMDNVVVAGVPEPGSTALFSLGMIGLCALGYRRRIG